MDYPGIDGFLGTRASLMLDVVFLAMFAVIPTMAVSVHLVKHHGKTYFEPVGKALEFRTKSGRSHVFKVEVRPGERMLAMVHPVSCSATGLSRITLPDGSVAITPSPMLDKVVLNHSRCPRNSISARLRPRSARRTASTMVWNLFHLS